jgi:hypothetical protein
VAPFNSNRKIYNLINLFLSSMLFDEHMEILEAIKKQFYVGRHFASGVINFDEAVTVPLTKETGCSEVRMDLDSLLEISFEDPTGPVAMSSDDDGFQKIQGTNYLVKISESNFYVSLNPPESEEDPRIDAILQIRYGGLGTIRGQCKATDGFGEIIDDLYQIMSDLKYLPIPKGW